MLGLPSAEDESFSSRVPTVRGLHEIFEALGRPVRLYLLDAVVKSVCVARSVVCPTLPLR